MKFYCHDTYTDLLRYAALGLPPSSFGRTLLLGDKNAAYRKAHKTLVPVSMGGHRENDDIVLNMFELVEERFPPIVRGSAINILNWTSHNGFANASDEEAALFIMFSEYRFLRSIRSIVRDHTENSLSPWDAKNC